MRVRVRLVPSPMPRPAVCCPASHLPVPPALLFRHLDEMTQVNRVMSEAGPPGNVSQRTFAACASRHGGCFLGLYRRDETGVRTMERLRRARVVPDDASCQLDTVGE